MAVTAVSERPAAQTQLGYSGTYASLTLAQKKSVNALATALAKGAKQQAAAVNAQQKAEAVKATQIQRSTNLVQLRGTVNATRIASLIANAQKAALNFVAAHGRNILSPAVQQQYNTQQTHLQAGIVAAGGSYSIPPLAGISPDIQNQQLALAGVGLTNAASAAAINAQVAGFNEYTSNVAAATAANAALQTQLAIAQADAESTQAYGTPGLTPPPNAVVAPPALGQSPTTPATIADGVSSSSPPGTVVSPTIGSGAITSGSVVGSGGGGTASPPVYSGGASAAPAGSWISGLSNAEVLVGAGAIIGGVILAVRPSRKK